MKRFVRILSILALLYFNGLPLWGQGCSDAGFCTIDAVKPDAADDNEKINTLKLGISYGAADHDIAIFGQYMEYSRILKPTWGLNIKLTSLVQQGNDISAFGLSDIYLNTHYNFTENFKLLTGLKFPLTHGNSKNNNRALPMDYQSSLGTVDLILGAGFTIQQLQLVAAYQQPLTQNQNAFEANNWPADSPLSNFQTTNEYKRRGDVLLRMSYPLKLTDNLSITASVLPIYHLGNDTFVNDSGDEVEISGSQGLTLNGNLFIDYRLTNSHFLQFNAGMPFVVRDARPDGLTRHYIATLEYRFLF